MKKDTIGRRDALKRALTVLGAATVAPQLLAACGSESSGGLSCTDTTGLSAAEISTRESQAYADSSADPNKKCVDCTFYTAGQAGACGTCSVIRGPIHPDGTCNLFARRS